MAKTTTTPRLTPYPLAIDYARSRAAMVAVGRYHRPNPDITDRNFPVGGGATTTTAVLVHLGRATTDLEVLAEIERRGLLPATMDELLALGEQHPELQHQFPIIAFGSVWRHRAGPRVGGLWADAYGRALRLHWLGDLFCRNDRFLAVPK